MMTLIDRVLVHRVAVLLAILVITGAALASLTRAEIGSSIGELFFGDSPDYLAYLERSKAFASDEVFVVGLEDIDVLAPETLDRLQALADGIWALSREGDERSGSAEGADDFEFEDDEPAPVVSADAIPGGPRVRYIASILNAQEIRSADEGLEVRGFADEARARPGDRQRLLGELQKDTRWSGLIVSDDGRSTALIVELQPERERRGERDAVFVDQVMAKALEVGFTPEQVHLAGMPALMVEVLRLSEKNLLTLFPIQTVLMLLIVFLLFRQVLPALIGLIVCSLGVIWTMGLAVAINPTISIMHSIAPAVILIVGSSDVIHLYSAYLIELDQGRPKRDAIIHACGDVGTACLYTSITTLIGFLGLTFVPTPVFRQLGITLGAGVAFTLLIAIFLVPVLQSLLPQPRTWRVGATSATQAAFDHTFAWLARFTERRAVPLVIGFALLTGACVWSASQIHIETRMVDRLEPDNPTAQDQRWFRTNFKAVNIVQLHVDTGQAGGVNDPALVTGMAELATRLEADPLVDTVGSVVDLHELVHEQLRPAEDRSTLPNTREAFAQYTLLYEMGGGQGLDRLVDFDRRHTLMMVRLHSEAVREAHELGVRARDWSTEHLGKAASVTPTGGLFLVGGWLDNVLAGQQRGLLFTCLLVALMMCVALRSVRAGLWSMLPNILPLLALGGVIGLIQDETDSDTLVLAMLAIGIGVDDTIHFLMRYRIETERGADMTEALRKTFDFAGRGIVMTTVVLSLGFLPFALTDYYSTKIMGTLLPFTLFMALVADLLLAPALARLGVFRFRSKEVST